MNKLFITDTHDKYLAEKARYFKAKRIREIGCLILTALPIVLVMTFIIFCIITYIIMDVS